MKEETLEIRWHGRGGQGAITAAKIVALAAFDSGFRGVVMAPSFGTERRGAPVDASLKISKTKIHDLGPIEQPDVVVVLDDALLNEVDVTGIEPMTSVTPMRLKRRDDVVTDGNQQAAVLSNAPDAREGFFAVPKVVE